MIPGTGRDTGTGETTGTGQGASTLTVHRIAVIGAGMIAPWHVKAIAGLPNAELVGICDHGTGEGEAIGIRCGCPPGVCELKRFISREDVHVVAVTTPSGSHGEIAELAARHRKHCIVEKPIEVTLERIDRMVEAHERAGTLLGGVFNLRFTPATRAGRPGRKSVCQSGHWSPRP